MIKNDMEIIDKKIDECHNFTLEVVKDKIKHLQSSPETKRAIQDFYWFFGILFVIITGLICGMWASTNHNIDKVDTRIENVHELAKANSTGLATIKGALGVVDEDNKQLSFNN